MPYKTDQRGDDRTAPDHLSAINHTRVDNGQVCPTDFALGSDNVCRAKSDRVDGPLPVIESMI